MESHPKSRCLCINDLNEDVKNKNQIGTKQTNYIN